MKVAIPVLGLLAIIVTAWLLNTESFQRRVKDVQSEYMGGLSRTCELASGNGTIQRRYEGKLDIAETSTANKVLFDLNGKRTVIIVGGGTFVCDEM